MKANKIMVSFLTLLLTVALMFSIFSVPVFAEEGGSNQTQSTPTSSSSSTTTKAPVQTDEHGHAVGDHDHDEENNLVETIVSLSIIGVIIVVIAIFCIIKREKVGKFLRSLKSEMKKIVWFSWKDTRKNSIVVIVAVIIIAAFIGILDLAFKNGVDLLYKLFH